MSTQKLSRPRQGRMIAGVCAGIARRFGWNPTIVRVVTVASVLIPGPQVLAYLICWVVIPNERPAA
jgi:phage shock protein PspC (stress-responsive transcriptional regulator)